MKNELREGKEQKKFDERRKNNPLRLIKHGVDSETVHCRICIFSGDGTMKIAKKHAQETGHTVDLYREHWIELTYYKKP